MIPVRRHAARRDKAQPKRQDKQVATSDKVLRDAHGRLMKGTASPNPAGRPRGLTLSEAARKMLAEHVPDDTKMRTWAELIVSGMMLEAGKRNSKAWRELRELTEIKRLAVEATLSDELRRLLAGVPVDEQSKVKADLIEIFGQDVVVSDEGAR